MVETAKQSWRLTVQSPISSIASRIKPPNLFTITSDTTSLRAPSKLQVATWGLIVLVLLAVSLSDYQTHQIGSWQDDRLFTILARSLAWSDTYGITSVPGDDPYPAPYPFGYPLVLSPLARFFPDNVDVLKLPSLLATVVNVSILFWYWPLFSRRSHWWGNAVLGLYVLQPQTIWHTRMVMSDPVFITFCLSSLVVAEQAVRGTWNWQRKLLMGILFTFLIFTRTVGVLFVAGIFVYVLAKLSKYWKGMFLVLATMLATTALVVLLTSVAVTDLVPERYLREKNAALIIRLLGIELPSYNPSEVLPAQYVTGRSTITPDNDGKAAIGNTETGNLELAKFLMTQHLSRDIRAVVFPIGGGSRERAFVEEYGLAYLSTALGYMITIVISIGCVAWVRRERFSSFNFSALVYIVPVLLWTWIGPRFYYPIQAQIFFAFLLGIEVVWSALARIGLPAGAVATSGRVLVSTTLFTMLAVFSYKSLTLEDTRTHIGDLKLRTTWVHKLSVPNSAIIMTEDPITDYVYGNRKTMPFPDSFSTLQELEAYVRRYGIDYVLIAPVIRWYPLYSPEYSDSANRMLNLMDIMESDGRTELVYYSEQNMVKAFYVER